MSVCCFRCITAMVLAFLLFHVTQTSDSVYHNYDLLNVFYRLQSLFISMKFSIVVMDDVMTLFVSAGSVM